MAKRKQRQPYSPPVSLDEPIFGGERIARAAGILRDDGEPDLDKFYYKQRAGLLAGVVHRSGRELVSTLRQLQTLGTRSVESA
jgi:hypothetical protein